MLYNYDIPILVEVYTKHMTIFNVSDKYRDEIKKETIRAIFIFSTILLFLPLVFIMDYW